MPPSWKEGRVKLDGKEFQLWKFAVLTRDKWRCRRCGSPSNLHVHHIRKRSDLRLDTLENGIALCARHDGRGCHQLVEAGKIDILPEVEGHPVDANKLVRFRFTE